MKLLILKDYQFILLILMCILLLLIILYAIKRRYDSIDKHINKKTKETYKECITEYETLSDELGITSKKINVQEIIKFFKEVFKRK